MDDDDDVDDDDDDGESIPETSDESEGVSVFESKLESGAFCVTLAEA